MKLWNTKYFYFLFVSFPFLPLVNSGTQCNTHHHSLYPSSLYSQPNPHHRPHLEIENYVKLLSVKATLHSTIHLRKTPPQPNHLSQSPPPSQMGPVTGTLVSPLFPLQNLNLLPISPVAGYSPVAG
ncbi:hypothetical protein Hanom_Chr02g00143281 [Helianthus anomalus]